MATDLMSSRRLAGELIKAIDVLSDVLAVVRDPRGYTEAYRDLYVLVGDEDRWASIFEVKPEYKSNRILHELGPTRIKWLKQWREDEVPKVSQLRKVLAE